MHLQPRVSLWRIPCRAFVILLLLAAGQRLAAAAESEPYFGNLAAEFSGVGPARFISGTGEADLLRQLQTTLSTGGELQSVAGEPFSKCRSFLVPEKPKLYWDASFYLSNREAISKGETVLVVFWAKGKKAPQYVDDGAGATVQPYLRASIGNFPKGRVTNFYDVKMLSQQWKRYYVKSAPLSMDFPPGTLSFVGMTGQKAQTVEIGGLAWLVFPAGADLTKLPKPDWDYEGRSPTAAWRQEAEKRIDQYRKGDLTIEVADTQGKPVPGAEVKVRMKQHAFIFGTAISAGAFAGRWKATTPEDVKNYRDISLRYFNSYTLENDLKWPMFESARAKQWQEVKDCMQFYAGHGKRIRGHVLVWPSLFRTPEPIKTRVATDNSLLGSTVRDHVAEEAALFAPWVNDWDVTNETQVNRDYMDRLGPEAMVEWYKAAHTASPKSMLTFNEPGFGADGMELGSFPEKLLGDKCRGWVDYLIQQGAPLDSLGCQAHGGRVGREFAGKTGPEGLWRYYDELFTRYGKKLQYTELDVNIGDPADPDQLAYQADMLRDSMIIAFAHPAFIGITQWGFWAPSHYAPNAALWTKEWQPTPAGQAYLDLVYKRWWTDAQVKTDAAGKCSIRGFFGDYEVSVGGKAPQAVRFEGGDKVIRVTQ